MMEGHPQGSTGASTYPDRIRPEVKAGVPTDTVFRGRRTTTAPAGNEVEVTVDGEPIDKRYDLLSASPSGFEWGYGGSGPSQLAIAILAHAYGDEFASEYYQRFKREVVAKLPEDGWQLTKRDLDKWREANVE